jgi:hypothetical protein
MHLEVVSPARVMVTANDAITEFPSAIMMGTCTR